MKAIWLILIGAIVVLYLMQPVPYCVQATDQPPSEESNAIYDGSEVSEVKLSIEDDGMMVFRTMGMSMSPTIKSNSRCLCMQKPSYQVNDIVIFFQGTNGGYQGVAHRIIEKEGENILTKGDNNPLPDIMLKEENLLCFIPTIRRHELLSLQSSNNDK